MGQKLHRIRIGGQIRQRHEQVIELSDEDLKGFIERLDAAKSKGDQAISDCLGEDYGDTDPVDWEYDEWSAELLDDNGSVIRHLDCEYEGD